MLLCTDTVVAQLSPSSDGLVPTAVICPLVLLCKDAAVAKLSPSAADLVGHHGYLKCLLVPYAKMLLLLSFSLVLLAWSPRQLEMYAKTLLLFSCSLSTAGLVTTAT